MPSSALGLGLVRTRSFISTLFLASPNLQPSRRNILERLWLPPPSRMMHNHQEEKGQVKSNPRNVDRVQQLLHSTSNSTRGWEKCWEEGAIPWDLGQPTPILLNLLRLGSLPTGRALVPGCGSTVTQRLSSVMYDQSHALDMDFDATFGIHSTHTVRRHGHDVVAIACPERYVVGLDISDTAINKAMELSSSSPNSDYLTFITEDFFTWHSDELFDLIFDYTFFCAIEPEMRPAWASRIQDLLKEDGELITLMFPISDHVDGPPYKVSVADYKEVLNPVGFKEICIMDNELAVGPRKGREKLGRWKRSIGQSLM